MTGMAAEGRRGSVGSSGRSRAGGRPERAARGTFLGRAGEEAAGRLLKETGMEIVQRNYRCRLGEIDIIAADGETLCFVEVKARRDGAFGSGLEAVPRQKQVRIRRAATFYLTRYGDRLPRCRFDVVEVRLDHAGRPESSRLIRNAF